MELTYGDIGIQVHRDVCCCTYEALKYSTNILETFFELSAKSST